MTKISDLLGRRLNEIPVGPDYTRPHPHASVGIEVELEGVDNYRQPFKRWHLDEQEGSLVNGVEFISEPVWGTAITDALEELSKYLKETDPYISFRTSVHIHLNVLDLSIHQLKNFIKLGIIYEPSFFRLHDKWDRVNNIFCVPTSKAILIQTGYSKLFNDLSDSYVRTNYLPWKYSAMNINCLKSLGTIEFRHMGGTDNVDKISDWINILLQMKVSALLEEPLYDPSEVWGEYEKHLDIHKEDLEKGKDIITNLDYWE